MHRKPANIIVGMLLCFLIGNHVHAQVLDDFSDGDFTNNPTWSGETSIWSVQNGELNSNGSGTDVIYLSTPSSRINDTEWRFRIRYTGGGPSNSNKIRIYLTSDQANLEDPLNGYFVEVGEGGSLDSYDLFKQSGSSSTRLIDGQDGLAGSGIDATVKVIRDNAGNWELFVDQGSLGLFVSQGTTSDTDHLNPTDFGIQVSHTSTRTKDFFLDDVYVGDIIQDTLPPALLSISIISNVELQLTFDEFLAQAIAETTTNYSIDNGIGIPTAASLDMNDGRVVNLSLANPLQNNQSYNLTLSNIEDLTGNALSTPISQSFTYAVPDIASFKDVIINEILADPTPTAGLPESEFLELFNRGSGSFNLENWTIDNGTTIGTLPAFTLGPGEYVILVRSGDENLFQALGNVITPSSWPALVNSGDNLGLRSQDRTLIDTVDYEISWYRDAVKDNGGFSLELINPNQLDCAPANNWIASDNGVGGTPGRINSVFSTAPDQIPPKVLSANVLGQDTVELCFTEGMNPSTFNNLNNYVLDNGVGSPIGVVPVGPDFNCVKLGFDSDIQTGISYSLEVKNVEDCSGNVLVTENVALAKGVPAGVGEVLISEFFPDFEPRRGLPLSEFVEIHNPTNAVIDLNGLGLSDGSATTSFPNSVIFPGEYVIVCSILDTADWNDFGRVIAVNSLPSLNNSSDSLRLVGPFFETIDYVFYSSDWYGNADKANGGWTLERIDNGLIDCNNPANWGASIDPRGGTPGEENSIKGTFTDILPPSLESIRIEGDDQIILTFSEPMNPTGLTEEINFSLDQELGRFKEPLSSLRTTGRSAWICLLLCNPILSTN